MPAAWKTVRVFISSTFRDMHAERDHLVKVTFPALRERLEKYRIHLVDVDLRWGITEEESQHDRVLDLCLQQIDECRPFFVGILGERYGWVPNSLSDEAASKYGWVQHHTGKSVTELEILYGVLNDPQMQRRAFFFFRDPAFVQKLDDRHRQVFCEGPTEEELEKLSPDEAEARAEDRRRKLADLKERIRQSVCPVMDGYPARWDPQAVDRPTKTSGRLVGLEEFGRRVQKDLWEAIKVQEGLPEVPPVVTLAEQDPLAEEAAHHEAFMESRLRVYVGREKVQQDLTEFADGDATVPCLVSGPSGSGKSAAMARFVRGYADSHRNVLVIPHFVGASPGSTSLRRMLRRFCLLLQERFGQADEVPQDVNGLVSRFRQSVEGVPSDARVVLVIDALNQLDETDNAHSLYWLPWQFPPQVKVVVSSIDDTPEGQEPSEPVLKALAVRPHESVRIEPLTDNERFEIVSQVPSMSAKKLSPKQIGLLLSNPATTNPLFLLVALEELRGFGSYEQLEARIAAFPRPEAGPVASDTSPFLREQISEMPVPLIADRPSLISKVLRLIGFHRTQTIQRTGKAGVPPVLEGSAAKMATASSDTVTAIFDQVIERLQEEFNADVVRTVLSLLACSRGGMSERELFEMAEGIGTEQPTSDVYPVLRQIRSYLQHRGELLDFFHRGLYKAVRGCYLPEASDSLPYHRDLADYFHRKLNPPGAEPWSGHYPRSFSELPHHQTKGQLWEKLETTLTALLFLEAKVQAGMAFELVGDFSTAVEALPNDRPQRRILKLLDEALRRDIHFIARHAQDYPQGLFQCLWNSCWWYDCPEAAQHFLTSPSGTGAVGKGGESPQDTRHAPWLQPADQKLSRLLEHWRNQRDEAEPSFPWLRALRPPPIHLGSAQQAVLRGHEGCVNSVTFSRVGDRIVSGCGIFTFDDDNTVRVWDASSGAELAVLRGHEGEVSSVAISPAGDRIVSGSSDHTVRVWDASSGAELAVLRGHEGSVSSVAFSPDGDRIVSGSRSFDFNRDYTVRVWDIRSGAELAVLRGHEDDVHSVAFSPAGDRIVSGSSDHTVRVWDARSGAELAVLSGHEDAVRGVAFSPAGDRIVSGSYDHTVRVWDARSGAELTVLRGHEERVHSVAYSPAEDRIVSGSGDALGKRDYTVRVWDASSGAELAVLRGHEGFVYSVAVSPAGDRIVSAGSFDHTVRVWDARSDAKMAVLRGHEQVVADVAFSPAGDWIVSGSCDNTVRVWDARIGTELGVLRGHEGSVSSVAFSPDGDRIVSGSQDQTVRVWNARSGAELAVLRGHEHVVADVAFSPDGNRIVSGSSDNTARVWDARSGAELIVLRGHESVVSEVVFSPGGDRIVTHSGDNTVRVWDASSGAELAVLRGSGDQLHRPAISPSRDRIVTYSLDNTARVRDARSDAELAVVRGHKDGVHSLAISPRGERIVGVFGDSLLGREDHAVRVWDARSGAELAVLRGHEDHVNSTAFSPGGDRIVSGSSDRTVRVWDARSGGELAVLRGHEDAVHGVAFSHAGDWIVSTSSDQTARVWDARNGECLEVIQDSGYVRAIPTCSQQFPLRALMCRLETVVERADSGKPVAWFPETRLSSR